VRVSPTTHSDIKRWPRPSRVGQSLTKTDVFDEVLGGIDVFHTVLRIASPHAIPVDLDLLG
jgi:hypothetical protein